VALSTVERIALVTKPCSRRLDRDTRAAPSAARVALAEFATRPATAGSATPPYRSSIAARVALPEDAKWSAMR
jgi:hypothetical protein